MIQPNFKNCIEGTRGTGLPECLATLGYPMGFIRTNKNWNIEIETGMIDKDFIVDQIQAGNFVPFLGAKVVTQNTPETTFKEYDNGEKIAIRNGKPEFSFEYSKTVHFNKIAYSHNGYKNGKVILTFSNGAIFLPESSDGLSLQGFDLAMQNTGTFKFKEGSEPGKTIITIQLGAEDQFNAKGVILSKEELGFDINNDIFGIIDTNIKLSPIAAGSSLVADIKASMNSAFNIKGLVADNFRVVINGSPEVAASATYNDIAGNYTIGTTSAMINADEVFVQAYDSVNDYDVAISEGLLFKGKSNTVVVA